MVVRPYYLKVTCAFQRLLFSAEKYELSGNKVAIYSKFSSLNSAEQLYYNQFTHVLM